VTLVTSIALRTRLISFSSLVLIARPTDRKPTLITRDEQLAVRVKPDVLATNLADVATQRVQRLRLLVSMDDHELVSVMRTGNQAGAGFHG
jgi:hypothetical protein